MNLKRSIKRWLYGSCPGFAGAFPYFGTKVYFPKGSTTFRVTCEQGIYEADNISLLCSLIKSDSLYFDIGANIGLMAIPALQKYPTCKVISFEPSPNSIQFLKRTIENSQYRERWQVIEKAVGKQVGVMNFFIASSKNGAFDGLQDTKRTDTNHCISVPITTIDAEWEGLGKPKVSVIKIDVEGAELDVVKGSLSCIRKELPYILLEWNTTNISPYGYSAYELLELAETISYRIYALPNIISIETPEELKIHMIRTESFLLAPKNMAAK